MLAQGLAHRCLDAFAAQPHQCASLAVIAGQAASLKHDGKYRLANAIAVALAQGARGGQKAGLFLSRQGVQLFQGISHRRGQARNVTRGALVGKGRVGPQRTQHLDHVRLAATKKARHPGRRCLRAPAQGLDVRFQNALEAFFIVALADKGLQLKPQGVLLLGVHGLVHFGHTLVFQGEGVDVLIKNVPVFHFLSCFGYLWMCLWLRL